MTEESTEKSPYTRPGFLAAAAVVLFLVIVAVIVIVNGVNNSDGAADGADTSPVPTTTEPPEPKVTGDKSICGLDKVEMKGTVDTPPEAEWIYIDDISFPVSENAGPGNDDPAETMNCFARTPEGAVFAAAAGMGQLGLSDYREGWAESNMVEGPGKHEALSTPIAESDGSTRVSINGFKLLSYDGNSARVDLGIEGAVRGKNVYLSEIVPLRWTDGDWKMAYEESDVREPAQLPNLAGDNVWPE